MSKELLIHGEAMNASMQGMLAVEQFLQDRYLFRRNVLNGKVEFSTKPADGQEPPFRPLTQQALNSIILEAMREDICEGANPKSDIQMYINSEEVTTFDPIRAYLDNLPQWDGQNHVAQLLNLSNKFDKEMALTNNLLVNLDELEAIRPSQHAALKQTLSKSKVNGRPIYGASQEDRPRYASFTATTNNRHPLTDATGSRRYICLTIPDGQLIDNTGEIDYDQLYAQVLYELREQNAPYWFNNDEVRRIQELNQEFMQQKDMAEIIAACFRKPKADEQVKAMNGTQMLTLLRQEYPSLKINHSTRIHLGQAMKELGFEHTERGHVAFYRVVPKTAA